MTKSNEFKTSREHEAARGKLAARSKKLRPVKLLTWKERAALGVDDTEQTRRVVVAAPPSGER